MLFLFFFFYTGTLAKLAIADEYARLFLVAFHAQRHKRAEKQASTFPATAVRNSAQKKPVYSLNIFAHKLSSTQADHRHSITRSTTHTLPTGSAILQKRCASLTT